MSVYLQLGFFILSDPSHVGRRADIGPTSRTAKNLPTYYAAYG